MTSKKDVTLKLDDFLCFSIYKTNRAFCAVNKEMLKDIGLTYPQFLVMISLWGSDNQTVGSLGQAVTLETSTLTPLLKRLEAQGLIARKRDVNDERIVVVSLTKTGAAMRRKTSDMPEKLLAKTRMTQKEFSALKEQMNLLSSTLLDREPVETG